jgi:hypothetical protein
MTSHPEPRLPDEPRLGSAEERAEFLLDAMIGYQHIRGRLSKVTIADTMAILATLEQDAARPEPELDAAWREAEEALPRDRNGTAYNTSGGRGLGLWRISSRAYQAEWGEIYATGPTPAAALRALASRLRSTKPG